MNDQDLSVVILAAGKGTRMKSELPKVLHPIAGQPMIQHVLDTAAALDPLYTVVVTAPGADSVTQAVADACELAICTEQTEQLGTGDAVRAAEPAMSDFTGTTLVLYGDTPLLTADTLRDMCDVLNDHDVVVLGMCPEDPGAYGRLVVGEDGSLEAIVEYKDASDEQRAIELCNSGVMAVRSGQIFTLLAEVTNDNAKGEYYLTDIVAIARAKGMSCGYLEAPEEELLGVNSRVELAQAESIWQMRKRLDVMESGVTLIDPDSVYFSADTAIAADVTIQPNVWFGKGVSIASGTTIYAYSHIEGANIGENCRIGPFARLRPGSQLAGDNKIGNFVELKKATLHPGAQASHLSYLGDAEIGKNSNIGAGTITCNYDGYDKYQTIIGDDAFIGSDTALIAPVKIGDGAIVGAGSVITENVTKDALALTRANQIEKPGWANTFREKKSKKS